MSVVVSHTNPEPIISEIHVDADGIVGDWIRFINADARGVTIAMSGSPDGSPGQPRKVTYVRLNADTFVDLVNELQRLADQVCRG